MNSCPMKKPLRSPIEEIINRTPDEAALASGERKIPWNEPEFSRRMLKEHLSQDHDLASRRREFIDKQVAWIDERFGKGPGTRLLDLGCGPGFYVERFALLEYDCLGIDFGPASIAYAKEHFGKNAQFQEADIRVADFGEGYDLVTMIYGEFNVFSEEDASAILAKAFAALRHGGRILIESQAADSVRRYAEASPTWYRVGPEAAGLFSEDPHLVLVESRWFAESRTSLQHYHVILADGGAATYRIVTKTWTDDEMEQLLLDAGFVEVTAHPDWPVPNADLQCWTGAKPE